MNYPSSSLCFFSIGPRDVQQIMALGDNGRNNPWTREMVLAELIHEHGFNFGVNIINSKELCSYILCRLFLDELHIHHICTHPAFRRQGLAGALLEHACSNARTRGARKALLEAASKNVAAIELYKRSGFATDFIRKQYYHDGDDALVMSRIL